MPPNVNMDTRQGRPHAHGGPGNGMDGGGDVRADGYPSRHQSQGVVASHFLAQGEEETWLQFLRHGSEPNLNPQPRHSNPAAAPEPHSRSSSPNYTLPNRPLPRTDSSSSRSSDRKRRLTTADSPRRRPSSIRMHSENAGDTRTDPIVLDSSPAPQRALPPPPSHPSRTNTESSRRQSDIVLPPWQPDSDVTQCPVCKRQFTFLFRKHHCRYVQVWQVSCSC